MGNTCSGNERFFSCPLKSQVSSLIWIGQTWVEVFVPIYFGLLKAKPTKRWNQMGLWFGRGWGGGTFKVPTSTLEVAFSVYC